MKQMVLTFYADRVIYCTNKNKAEIFHRGEISVLLLHLQKEI